MIHDKNNLRQRNTRVEALRIAAMLGVICMHDIADGRFYTGQSYLADVIIRGVKNLGGLSDCLFFSITAWFLCVNQSPTLKRSMSKIWKLEQQLLFYSISIYMIFVICKFNGFTLISRGYFKNLSIYTIMPTLTGLWWYPTSYCFFIILYPWLDRTLHALGPRAHGWLAFVMFAVWGCIPLLTLDMVNSVWLFLYLYVLISYMRWYHNDLLQSRKFQQILFLISSVCIVFGDFVGARLLPGMYNESFVNSPRMFPAIMLSFSLLMWATQKQTLHRTPTLQAIDTTINVVASGAFAAFLIIMHPWVQMLLNTKLHFVLEGNPWRVVTYQLALPPIFFAICVVIDLARQLLFHFSIDYFEQNLFNRVWQKASESYIADRIRQFLNYTGLAPQKEHIFIPPQVTPPSRNLQ